MTRVLVFDVNETLLDVRALAPHFREVLGRDDLLTPWFGRLLRSSLVATITKAYRRFDELGVHALRATALEAGVEIDESAARRIVDEMRLLPAHPDVPDAFAPSRPGPAGSASGHLPSSSRKGMWAVPSAPHRWCTHPGTAPSQG